MIVSNQNFHKFVLSALACLMVIDAGLLFAHHRVSQAILEQDLYSYFRDVHGNRLLQMPTGFAENGTPQLATDPTQYAGVVVRFASRNCHYCQQDQPLWSVVAKQALQNHYQIVIVTPTSGAEYPRPSLNPTQASQVTFVNLQWTANLRLRGTPTTLIADTRSKFLWGHEGALTDEDAKMAVAAMERAH